ncbi:SpoIIE family protein phosphatase [Streptomyces sp. GC420]|uniref:SpoIIE family protein phosphatase n=1 Tax=Streptomyces sp. GC420 TaxID=2697568 RepID=UPI001415239E|nr:SpoIIE family protein phosphatase [Streptomyces sp. GC420]NBM17610.1 SpoIIE family protein phosphatase [Streptomyces sp. GC420]
MVVWDEIGDLVDAHERFLAGERTENIGEIVRTPILTSWRRCKSLGLAPDQVPLAHEDPDLDGRLLRASAPVLDLLTTALGVAPVSVILADSEARVLSRLGGDGQLNRYLDAVQIVPGFAFPEHSAGTNAVGTALAERRPLYVLGREHFADCMSPLGCAGAPVRDPLSGRVEGVLDLTCFRPESSPAMLTLVRRAASEIERRLLEQSSRRERELLAAFLRSRPEGAGQEGGGPLGACPARPARPVAADGGIDRIDQAILREKAEELIATPLRAPTEVPISRGRVAVLVCREVRAPSGECGIVVEAAILSGSPRLRIPVPAASAPAPTTPARSPAPAPELSGAGVRGAPQRLVRKAARGLPGDAVTPHAPPAGREKGLEAVPRTGGGNGRGTTGHTTAPLPPRRKSSGRPAAGGAAASVAEALDKAVRTLSGPVSPEIGARLTDQAGGTQAGLLLVGEPGVGRLALLARQRLELLYDASVRIGRTLDVTRTAEELTETVLSRFADFVAVDLPDSVLRGEEPTDFEQGLRRIALGAVREGSHLYGVGEEVRWLPMTPQARCLESGAPVLEPDLSRAAGWMANDPARSRKVVESGVHSLIAVPMRARGVILGVVSFYRADRPGAFEEDDLWLADELVGRAAVCIDNARRYTREHTAALALQRSLLPRDLPRQTAVEVAHRYLPAQAKVGGDWFDIIPLSGARVALVVGDVVGHGVHAAATMGQLRTAVQNFSALDLPPEDLLAHLDDLVGRMDADSGGNDGVIGATCLYAVYDPVSRRCAFGRAGHPPPALVLPDGRVDFLDVPAGQPLGLGGLPFEPYEVDVPEGSQIVLYTDGLVEDRCQDIDSGLDLLRRTLAAAAPGERSPEETCEAVLAARLTGHPGDDVALLVARTRALPAEQTAHWQVPADPALVSQLRSAVTSHMEKWDLSEQAPVTELIVSELVTNAMRHGSAPIHLRLLRDQALICEVSDGSSTSPRLRRACTTDEGGRGLFLVAQLAERWGTRYTPGGKVIWTEQTLPPEHRHT